jgi:hypothetical protein
MFAGVVADASIPKEKTNKEVKLQKKVMVVPVNEYKLNISGLDDKGIKKLIGAFDIYLKHRVKNKPYELYIIYKIQYNSIVSNVLIDEYNLLLINIAKKYKAYNVFIGDKK